MKLNETIGRLRRERGMSQEKLAEEMGVSRQAISKWESGAAMPEIERLEDLSRLFGVTVEQLMGLAELEEAESAQIPEETESEQQPEQGSEQWQQDRPTWNWKKFLAWTGAGTAGLLLAVFAATAVWSLGQLRQLNQQYQDLYQRVSDVNTRLRNFESMSPLSLIPAGSGESSLFSTSSVNLIQVLPEEKKVEIALQATLADYQAGTQVSFLATGDGMEPVTIAVSDSKAPLFMETIQLPLSDDIQIVAHITRPDGQVQTQSIGQLYGLKSEYSFHMDAVYKGEARCDQQGVEFAGPCQIDISGGRQLFLQRVEVKVFADGKETASAGMDASDWHEEELGGGASQAMGNMTCYPYLEAKVEARGSIQMEAVLIDDQGEVLNKTVAVWLKNDQGIFEKQAQQITTIALSEAP